MTEYGPKIRGYARGLNGSLNAAVGTTIDVDGAGHVAVDIDGGRLMLNGIEANTGFCAHVVTQTAETVIVEFRSATETATVLVTNLGGTVASGVTTQATASGDADLTGSVGGDADADASLEGNGSADAETATEAEAEAEIGIEIGVKP